VWASQNHALVGVAAGALAAIGLTAFARRG
jgi:hypothetical protein